MTRDDAAGAEIMLTVPPPITEGATTAMSPTPPSQSSKSQRVLACVLCQQRKVKCDRKFPCVNCIKSQAHCVPATQVSRRGRRRFPKRELLERLRKYEDLLRQNNIKFEPLCKDPAREDGVPNVVGGDDSDDEHPKAVEADWSSPSTTVNSERVYEAKNMGHAMSPGFREPENDSYSSDDDVSPFIIKNAWEQLFKNNDHLLFGSRKTAVNISTLHPEPVQIFRLWQIYLDNVNPLLRVTHTPTMQGHIIEAASNVLNISPTLEALMFSIYSMSILSLSGDDCQAMLGSSREDLLTRYQFGCQQALLNCGFLRCNDRDCLTALYLYLVSVKSSTVPQSLSSMLAIAIHIAQRMGIHSESALAKCTALEAEMRRRLWWSLIVFDTRIREMASHKTSLAPAWDCRIPLNVNDSDFRPEMKEPPQIQGKYSEALFVVVRSELGESIHQTILKHNFNDIQHDPMPKGSELASLEKMIEDKYLKFCDPENPLHFMTIWTTRAYFAKCHLAEQHSRYYLSSVHQTEAQSDAIISYALSLLACDTKIITSPITKGFVWLAQFYFPFPAYIHVAQALKRRPDSDQAGRAWEVMSDNYEAHFEAVYGNVVPLYRIFTNVILQSWEAREAMVRQPGEALIIPKIVLSIRSKLAIIAQNAQSSDTGQPSAAMGIGIDDFPMSMSMSMGFDSPSILHSNGGYGGYLGMNLEAYPNMPGHTPLDIDGMQLDWAVMDWNFMNTEAGESTGLSLQY